MRGTASHAGGIRRFVYSARARAADMDLPAVPRVLSTCLAIPHLPRGHHRHLRPAYRLPARLPHYLCRYTACPRNNIPDNYTSSRFYLALFAARTIFITVDWLCQTICCRGHQRVPRVPLYQDAGACPTPPAHYNAPPHLTAYYLRSPTHYFTPMAARHLHSPVSAGPFGLRLPHTRACTHATACYRVHRSAAHYATIPHMAPPVCAVLQCYRTPAAATYTPHHTTRTLAARALEHALLRLPAHNTLLRLTHTHRLCLFIPPHAWFTHPQIPTTHCPYSAPPTTPPLPGTLTCSSSLPADLPRYYALPWRYI